MKYFIVKDNKVVRVAISKDAPLKDGESIISTPYNIYLVNAIVIDGKIEDSGWRELLDREEYQCLVGM